MTFYDSWALDGQGHIVVYGISGNPQQLCEEVWVEMIHIDLLTGTREVIVGILLNGQCVLTQPFPRNQMISNPIDVLTEYGLNIVSTGDCAVTLSEVLMDTEVNAKICFIHHQLGFASINGEEVFLLSDVVMRSGAVPVTSSYYRPEMVENRGDLEGFLTFLKAEILGHPGLEIGLAIGVSAVLVPLLIRGGLITELPIFSIVGKSTTGKTTLLKLIAALFGNPSLTNGLVGNFDATRNALFARFSRMIGMPLLLDEATYADVIDKGFIHSLSAGKDRERCNSSGELKDPLRFCGAFVISSEKSLIDECDANTGANARVTELNLSWTDSADHAMRIDEALVDNHGTFAPVVIRWILENQEFLPDMFRARFSELREEGSSEAAISERALKHSALILTAADVINTAVPQLGLNISEITDVLLAQYSTHRSLPKSETSEAEALSSRLHELILANAQKYLDVDRTSLRRDIPRKHVVGSFEYIEGRSHVFIVAEEFERYLANLHFSKNEACKTLKKAGLIRQFDGRYKFQHNIGGLTPRCYCLPLPARESVVSILARLPEESTLEAISSALHSNVLQENMGVARNVPPDITTPDIPALSFARASPASYCIILSKSLFEKLDLKRRVKLLPAKGENALVLMKDCKLRAAKSSLLVERSKSNDFICNDYYVFEYVTKSCGLEVPQDTVLTFYGIKIEKRGGLSYGIVNLDPDDSRCCRKAPVDEMMELPAPFIPPIPPQDKTSPNPRRRVNSLLEDDSEE